MNIRSLAHLSFFALAIALPACGGTADTGTFFDWGIVDVGAPDTAPFLNCDESVGIGATVVLEAQDLSRGGVPQTFSYPCKAGGGTVPLLAGQYAITVRLLRADNIAVSSLPLGTVSVARRGQTDLGVIVFEIQSLSLNWLIKQAANPTAPVTCAAVGATQVELTVTAATQAPTVFRFPCTDGQGQTQAVTVGAYVISARLLNAVASELSNLSLDFVTPNNTPAVLPLVTFTVN